MSHFNGGTAGNPKSYGKCHRQIAVGTNATLTLDKDLHYLVFVYNETYDQECWFSTSYPTALSLPMEDAAKECATPGNPPAHPWPHKDQFNLEVQPAGTSGRAQANVSEWSAAPGIKAVTLVVDGRMVSKNIELTLFSRTRLIFSETDSIRQCLESRQ